MSVGLNLNVFKVFWYKSVDTESSFSTTAAMVSASARNAGDPWCESRFGATDFCVRIHLFILFHVSFLTILVLNNLSAIPESNHVHQKSNRLR